MGTGVLAATKTEWEVWRHFDLGHVYNVLHVESKCALTALNHAEAYRAVKKRLLALISSSARPFIRIC